MDFSTLEHSANVREWQYLKNTDFETMDRENTVVMVSCSPLEVHGPHLPVVTDIHEADGLLLRSMELLNERHPNLEFLHLPPIYVAADVLPHRGSIMFRSSTITRVFEDLGRSLAKQGFKHIWISNFHGGPRHFVPIEVACKKVNKKYGIKMVSAFSMLITRLTNGGTDLSDILGNIDGMQRSDLEGDSHGGVVETSMMLHLLNQYVDPEFEKLSQRTVNIKLKDEGKKPIGQENLLQLLRGFKYKLKYYETETYAGQPKSASPDKGKAIVDILAEYVADAFEEIYYEGGSLNEAHSPTWKLRWLFTNPLVSWLFESVLKYDRSTVF